MKRTPLKRKATKISKAGTKRGTKARPANPCSWSNRCRTDPRIIVGTTERYCNKHATAVLDALVRAYVKDRDGWTCVKCGKTAHDGTIQWAHIKTRGARFIRWMVDNPYPGNSVTLCSGCHYAYTLNENNWRRFIESRWPGHYDRLTRINAEHERAGGTVDRAALITEFRAATAAGETKGRTA